MQGLVGGMVGLLFLFFPPCFFFVLFLLAFGMILEEGRKEGRKEERMVGG